MRRYRRRYRSGIITAVICVAVLSAFLIGVSLFVFPDLFKPQENKEAPYKKGESLVSDMIREGEEIRGVYVATVSNINYPSSRDLSVSELVSELDGIIDTCLQTGLNTVVFQVRPSCDAFYDSSIFPSSVYLTGEQGSPAEIDVLQELVTRAHEKDIAVVAWVNPLRVTSSGTDINTLAPGNPARMNPEYCVEYAGALYLDPAYDAVCETVARGCAEIASNYAVDAILFDDYFYPYPKDGQAFDDSRSYQLYAEGMDIDDWRRENINRLIKKCYEAIKVSDEYCLFGVAPFGIWSNNDGQNGGSDTRGLDAYNEIYCDALAWAEGGYVDFLAPQIYWSFDSAAAPYGHLASWWNERLLETDVFLLSSNAGYRASEWEDPAELEKQLEHNRTLGYKGALIYSYASLTETDGRVISCLSRAYSE